MKDPVLSICIPTYNRDRFLDEAIESVINQITDDIKDKVELCISDNASTDNTDKIVAKWKNKSPIRIVYHKNKENLGPDRNYLKVVEIANGKYCWFLGSDDKIVEGGIKKILDELKEECDIYLCNRIDCDFNMRPMKKRYWLNKKIKNSKVFNLSDKKELIKYLDLTNSLGGLFSYLSSIIFKKENWDSIKIDEIFIGTAYSHVYMLLMIIKSTPNCKLKYLIHPYVLNRGNNDSFLIKGDIYRFMIDIDGYTLLADTVLKNDKTIKRAFLKVLTREHKWYRILKIFAMCKQANNPNDCKIEDIEYKLKKIGFNRILINSLKIFALKMDKFIFHMLKIKRSLRI